MNKQDIINKSLVELKDLAMELSEELSKTVFSEESKKVLKSLRVLLDLETLAIKVKLCGSAHVAAIANSK